MATTWATAGDMGNQGAQLYVPGQSKMAAGDTFLGGTGTGISDAQLNGAQRIYGNTAADTSKAYGTYQTNQANTAASAAMQANIDSLKASQIAASQASLGKARDASLSNLGAEQAKIEPQYYADRNTASTQSQLGAKNFAEFLAARGGTNSGVANQGQIASNVALQGQLGSLNAQEQGANNDIARRTTDIGNAYNSDMASAEAGANSTALQNTLTQMNADRTFNAQQTAAAQQQALAEGQMTGTYNGQDTLAKQSQTSNEAYQQQQIALAKQQADTQATQFQQQFGLSVGEAIGNYQGNPTLAAKAQQIQQAQFAATQAQQQAQFNASLAASQAKASASAAKKSSSGSGSGGGTSAQNKVTQTNAVQAEIQKQIDNGVAPGDVQMSIESQQSALTKAGVSMTDAIKYIYNYAGIETKPSEL